MVTSRGKDLWFCVFGNTWTLVSLRFWGFSRSFHLYDPFPPPPAFWEVTVGRTSCSMAVKEANGAEKYWEGNNSTVASHPSSLPLWVHRSWTLRSPGPCVNSRVDFNVRLNDTRGSSVWIFSSFALSLSTADILWGIVFTAVRRCQSDCLKDSQESGEEDPVFPQFISQERKTTQRDYFCFLVGWIRRLHVFVFRLGIEKKWVSVGVSRFGSCELFQKVIWRRH